MRKLIPTLLLLAAGVSVFASDPLVVKVAAFNYYPGIFMDKDGVVKGFYVDTLAAIGERENIRFEYIYGAWSQGLDRIKSGQVDVLTSVAWTQERAAYMDFSNTPLLTVWGELYVTRDSRIDSIMDIEGMRIAVMKDDYNGAYFKDLTGKFGITCDFVEVPGFEDVFSSIVNKVVDAGVVNSTYGSSKQAEYNLRSTGVVFNPFDIYLTVAKGKNGDLLSLLDGYLATWRYQENSVYSKSRKNWTHGSTGVIRVIPVWLGYALIILLVAGAFGVVFIYTLRRKVKDATADIRQREASLQASEALFRSYIEFAPVGIFEGTFEGRILAVNPSAVKMTGFSAEELLSISLMDDGSHMSPDVLKGGLKMVRETGRSSDEVEIQMKNGELRWWQIDGVKISDEKFLAFVEDITEKRQTNQAIKDSRILLESSIESPNDILIVSVDKNFNYLYFNSLYKKSIKEEFGVDIEIGMNSISSVRRRSGDKTMENFKRALDGENHISVEEYGANDKDYYETRYNPIFSDGEIIGATAFSSRITERVLMIEQLKESEEQYRTLLEISLDAIFINQDLRVTYVNPAAVKLFGAENPAQILGKSPLDLFHPDYHPKIRERIARMLESGESVGAIEEKIVRVDGGLLDVEVAATPFSSKGSRAIQVILHDITQRKKAEAEILNFNATLQRKIAERTEELEMANKELDSFTYSVSHDLRAPLRAVSGFSNLLAMRFGKDLGTEGNRLLNVVISNGKKMDDIINGLLNLSRMKKEALHYARVDMRQLAQSVYQELSDGKTQWDFGFGLGEIPPAWGDEALLRQVWFNLISNAVKYSMKSDRKKIEIGSRDDESGTVYFVRDFGTGFDQKYAGQLFGLFQRLHSPEEYEGTGIGLSIVKQIVHAHKGKVWAEGESGKGACFYFLLPHDNGSDR